MAVLENCVIFIRIVNYKGQYNNILFYIQLDLRSHNGGCPFICCSCNCW